MHTSLSRDCKRNVQGTFHAKMAIPDLQPYLCMNKISMFITLKTDDFKMRISATRNLKLSEINNFKPLKKRQYL